MQSISLLKDTRGFYWIPALTGWGIIGLFTTRGRDYSFAHEERACKARIQLYDMLGISASEVVSLGQVHGSRVACIRRASSVRSTGRLAIVPAADAAVTRIDYCALTVLTADCLPVLLIDLKTRAMGIAHAGWRGLAAGVLTNAVDVMKGSFGARADTICAYIGPGIRRCCYRVGPELRRYFKNRVVLRQGEWYLDLVAAAEDRLRQVGLKQERIFDVQRCTFCDADFYSFRRGQTHARTLSLLSRAPCLKKLDTRK